MFRVVLGAAFFTVPITMTVMDVFGYVAKVEGASMQPCLNPEHSKKPDYVILNRWQARNFEFERGEVVSLSNPNNSDQKLIKRIIGLQGDTIKTLTYGQRYVHIPEGYCWIEGDHHGQSMDSNLFGPVPVGLIHAKASHIVWPPERWRRIEKLIPKGRQTVKSVDYTEHVEQILDEMEQTKFNSV